MKKKLILIVAFILISAVMFSVFSMGVTAAGEETINDNNVPLGNLPPGYSDGEGEAIPDATVPLGNVDLGDDGETIDDNKTPLVVIDIIDKDDAPGIDDAPPAAEDDGKKPNPVTGDNILMFVVLASISLAAISTIVVSKKKARSINAAWILEVLKHRWLMLILILKPKMISKMKL